MHLLGCEVLRSRFTALTPNKKISHYLVQTVIRLEGPAGQANVPVRPLSSDILAENAFKVSVRIQRLCSVWQERLLVFI